MPQTKPNPFAAAFAGDIPKAQSSDIFTAAFASDIPEQPGVVQGTKNALIRGGYNTAAAGNIAGLPDRAVNWETHESAAADIARHKQAAAQYPMSPRYRDAMTRASERETVPGAIWELVKNPLALPELIGESLPYSAPILAGGAAGAFSGAAASPLVGPAGPAVGGAVGAGKATYEIEKAARVLQFLEMNGIDLENPAAIEAALGDQLLMQKAHMHSTKGAIPIAAASGISFGVAGQLYRMAKSLAGTSRPVTGAVVGSGLEVGQQGFTEGFGEYLGQKWLGEFNPEEVAAEVVAGTAMAAPEAAIMTAAEARRARIDAQQTELLMAEINKITDELKGAEIDLAQTDAQIAELEQSTAGVPGESPVPQPAPTAPAGDPGAPATPQAPPPQPPVAPMEGEFIPAEDLKNGPVLLDRAHAGLVEMAGNSDGLASVIRQDFELADGTSVAVTWRQQGFTYGMVTPDGKLQGISRTDLERKIAEVGIKEAPFWFEKTAPHMGGDIRPAELPMDGQTVDTTPKIDAPAETTAPSFKGKYRDGGQWSSSYRAVKRTDGTFAIERTLTDDDGTSVTHLREDGVWHRGEAPRTTVILGGGVSLAKAGVLAFDSESKALASATEDAASMGAAVDTPPKIDAPKAAPQSGVAIPDGIQFDYPTLKGDFRWGGNQAYFSFRLGEGTQIQRSPKFESKSLAESVAQAVDWVRQKAAKATDVQKRILERQIEDSLLKVEGAKGLLKTQPLIDLSRYKAPGKGKSKAAWTKEQAAAIEASANEFIAENKAHGIHPESAWAGYAGQNSSAFRISKAEFMKRYAPGHKVTPAQQILARELLKEAEAAGNQAAVLALRDLAEARDPTEGGVPVDNQLKTAQEMLKKRETPATAKAEPEGKPTKISLGKNFVEARPVDGGWEVSVSLETKNSGKRFKLEFPDNKPFPSKDAALRAAAERVRKLADDMMLDSWGKFADKIEAGLSPTAEPKPAAKPKPEPKPEPEAPAATGSPNATIEVGKSRRESGTPVRPVTVKLNNPDVYHSSSNDSFRLAKKGDMWLVEERYTEDGFKYVGWKTVGTFRTPKQAETFLGALVKHVTGFEARDAGKYSGNVYVPEYGPGAKALLDPELETDLGAAMAAIKPADIKRMLDGELMYTDLGDGTVAYTDGHFLQIGPKAEMEAKFGKYDLTITRSHPTVVSLKKVIPSDSKLQPAEFVAVYPAHVSEGIPKVVFTAKGGYLAVNPLFLKAAGYTQGTKVLTGEPNSAIKLVNPDGTEAVVMPLRLTDDNTTTIKAFVAGKDKPKDPGIDALRRPGKRTGMPGRAGAYSATRLGSIAQTREVPNSTAQMVNPVPEILSSSNEQIWRDAGLDPVDVRLLPIAEQARIAADILTQTFGFKGIVVDNNLQTREAVDAMMDAYVGLHSAAYVHGLTPTAMSLDGKITLQFHKSKGQTLAYYAPATNQIGMIRRNDAYFHEWTHAVDWMLATEHAADLMHKKGRGLSGKTRVGGQQSTLLPTSVKEAFGNVLTAMFFDDAKLAAELLDIETKLADPTLNKKVRAQMEKRLQSIEDGAARPRKGQESVYYRIAKAIDGSMGAIETDGGGGYWQRPTEMLARASEAYTAHLIENSKHFGFTDFVTMQDRRYLENTQRFMGVAYPNVKDRAAIFKAFEELFAALREDGVLEARRPNDPIGDALKLAGEQPLDENTKRKLARRTKSFAHESQTVRRVAHEQERANQLKIKQLTEARQATGARVSELNLRLDALRDAAQNSSIALMYTIRGMLFTMRDRYPNSQSLHQIIEWFATDPGSGKPSGPKYEETLRIATRKLSTRLKKLHENSAMALLSEEELASLHEVLVDPKMDLGKLNQIRRGPHGEIIIRAAGLIRKFLDDIYSQAQSHGLDLGYAGNFMKRMPDAAAIALDSMGFITTAAREYKNVFARDFGTVEKGVVLEEFIPEMRNRIGKGHDLYPVRKEIDKLVEERDAALEEFGEGSNEVAEIDQQLNDLIEEVYAPIQDAWSLEAATHWHDAIRGFVTSKAFSTPRGPTAKSTKPRQLTENADLILKDYMITDPMELVSTYATQMTRLMVYGDFFGRATKDKTAGYKLADELTHMRREGVLDNDAEQIVRAVELMTGKYRTVLTRSGLRNWAKFNSLMVPFIMSRAIFSQLHEPAAIGLRSGNQFDTLRAFGMQLQDLASHFPGVNPNSVTWRREMGEFLGIYTTSLAEEIMQSRFNLLYQSMSDNRRLAKFFVMSLIQPHAMSMRRAAMSMSFSYLPKMARRAVKHQGTAKGESATMALNELGLFSAEDIAAAAKLHRGMSPETMENTLGVHEFARINTAIARFVDEAVQDPKIVDKPRLATQPEFSYMYGLLSFNAAFQRNVVRRSVKQIRTLWQDVSKTQAVKAAASTAIGYSVLTAGMYASLVARMALFGGKEYWDDLDDKEKALAMLGRLGIFGTIDPVINGVLALKYRRSFEAILAGPYLGTALAFGARLVAPYQTGSTSSNRTEYNALETLYNIAVISTIAKALERTPAGGVLGKAVGAGIMYGTSKDARTRAADATGEAIGMDERTQPNKGQRLRFQ